MPLDPECESPASAGTEKLHATDEVKQRKLERIMLHGLTGNYGMFVSVVADLVQVESRKSSPRASCISSCEQEIIERAVRDSGVHAPLTIGLFLDPRKQAASIANFSAAQNRPVFPYGSCLLMLL